MADRLATSEVLVIDCQSTGSTPAQGHLLEIGWARCRPGPDVVAELTVDRRLVALPEGERVPRVVARLTGITTEDLEDAEDPEAVWRALRAAAQPPGRAVIHFAQFERRFLQDLADRFDPDADLPFEITCTHAIAKRLLPDLPRRSLRALAGYYGFSAHQLRRAEDHVAATAFVWSHLVTALAERGVHTWDELDAWRASAKAKVSKRKTYPMPREKRLGLPDAPGVYRFCRTNGDILYVGKATSLKHRVNSHFTKQAGLHERALEMLSQARDLDVTVTATALEAALLETDEIKTLAPPYNVALLQEGRHISFATSDLQTTQPAPDPEHPIGPLSSPYAVGAIVTLGELLTGELPEQTNRFEAARALGIMPVSTPQSDVFLLGLAQFRARHLGDRDPDALALTRLARRLWAEALSAPAAPPRPEDAEWDADRVVEHLEDALRRVPQQIQRARWLRQLTDAIVAFSEPGAEQDSLRVLILEAGEVTDRHDLPFGAPLPAPPHRGRSPHERRELFDVARYDRLRVLVTELKRILRDGGRVQVRLDGRAALTGAALERSLSWL